MIRAECRSYVQFKDSYARLLNWNASAGEPVPPPVLYSSLPGAFTLFALYSTLILRLAMTDMPESFINDFPQAVEVGGLGIV